MTEKYSNCELCGNTFSDEEDLKLQIKVKHGKKYHQCESCKNTFSDEDDLKLHVKVRHGKTCHKCELCDKTFSDEEDLNLFIFFSNYVTNVNIAVIMINKIQIIKRKFKD